MDHRILSIAGGGTAVRLHPTGKGAADAPLALLRACHERIRLFTSMAVQIAGAAAVTEQVSQAAVAAKRYFFEALPKHVADEEESLQPRLALLGSLASPLSEVVRQHRELEDVLDRLEVFWRRIASGESPGAPLPALTGRMAQLWDAHLAIEEQDVFPAVQRLDPDERGAIWQEMRARRARTEVASAKGG